MKPVAGLSECQPCAPVRVRKAMEGTLVGTVPNQCCDERRQREGEGEGERIFFESFI